MRQVDYAGSNLNVAAALSGVPTLWTRISVPLWVDRGRFTTMT
jgi:hypothetical protein